MAEVTSLVADALCTLQELPGFPVFRATLMTLINNVIQHPNEPKYRKLNRANTTLKQKLFFFEGAEDVLGLLGWLNEGEFLVLAEPDIQVLQEAHALLSSLEPESSAPVQQTPPPAAPVPKKPSPPSELDPGHAEAAKKAIELKQRFERERKERAEILAQMRADRKDTNERHVGDSKAEKRTFGANVMKASDVCNTRGG
eukprot:TRINITY_DN85859_c0_g1_i1.p1 TRINITY_DN85859_c0_g1~~TRINITY_DN85859_c0_g1_i1.p1  ORF type:complete len:199 (+),score=47.64 TRINITY_DN85859_c0_g1_i1:39-635(+)